MLPSAGHCFSLHHIMALDLRALYAHVQQHPEVSVGGKKTFWLGCQRTVRLIQLFEEIKHNHLVVLTAYHLHPCEIIHKDIKTSSIYFYCSVYLKSSVHTHKHTLCAAVWKSFGSVFFCFVLLPTLCVAFLSFPVNVLLLTIKL